MTDVIVNIRLLCWTDSEADSAFALSPRSRSRWLGKPAEQASMNETGNLTHSIAPRFGELKLPAPSASCLKFVKQHWLRSNLGARCALITLAKLQFSNNDLSTYGLLRFICPAKERLLLSKNR
jgi:hypothetical protein